MAKGIDLEFSLNVKCEKCGENLDCDFDKYSNTIKITPCESCIEEAKQASRENMEEQIEELKYKIYELEKAHENHF